MLKRKEIAWTDYDAYLFDLGGVIVDISPASAIEAFRKLGLTNLEQQITQGHHNGLFKQYELGAITTTDFINQIQDLLPQRVVDQQIIDAWNKMLVDLPVERLHILQQLKKKAPIFLLSNTNQLHRKSYEAMAEGFDVENLFTKAFYSYEIHLNKPDREAFEFVINSSRIRPEKTLFLDDLQLNLDAAKELGFQTLLVSKGQTIIDIFSEI